MISAIVVYNNKKIAVADAAFCPVRALRTASWSSVTAPTTSAVATMATRQPLSRSAGRCSNTVLSFSAGGGKNETVTSSSLAKNTPLLEDLVGMLIAFQLLGLVNAVNAPDFYRNGGWLQPPLSSILDEDHGSSSTLASVAGRFALNAIVWILAAVSAPTELKTPYQNRRQDKNNNNDTLFSGSELGILLGWFCLLRVLAAFSIASVTQQEPPAFEMILQECYFVGLGIVTTRFLVERSRR
jgi:hypothetical protein